MVYIVMACRIRAYTVIAEIVAAYIAMVYIVMANIVMACRIIVYTVIADIITAYIVMDYACSY